MTIFQSIFLGILQGVAEFLPISSSGHLIVAQKLFDLNEVPLIFDVLLHLATLFAVLLVFRKKITSLFASLWRFVTKNTTEDDAQNLSMIVAILVASFITGVFGIIIGKIIPDLPIQIVFCGFLITSALLIFSSIMSKKQKEQNKGFQKITIKQGLFVGLIQGIGVLPGISRSGSTISATLFCGIDRSTAGEFSFLLSIPAIIGAFILEAKDLTILSQTVSPLPLFIGCSVAFVSGLLSLKFLLKLIKKGKLEYFAFYLIPLAVLGLIFIN
ncbi:MAG: undecaprenyl-diphosphate phosphatase [Treponema sp.]|nr:undecaprenyl-diphosphate phosphatase [Treponema sp.]